MKPLQLIIPAHLRYLAMVRDSFYSFGSHANIGYDHIHDIVLAVDEALSNIIEHNYRQVPDKTIKVTCSIRRKKLIVVIEDKGGSYSFAPPSESKIKDNIDRRSRRGFGQFLISTLMSKVKLSGSKAKGNKLILEKVL